MIRPVLAAALACALVACKSAPTPEPIVTVREVRMPVAVPCKPNLGPAPAYADTDDALRSAPDLFERVKLLLAGRLQRIGREGELTAALQGCAGP